MLAIWSKEKSRSMRNIKIIRACTVSQSVGFFVGMIPEFREMDLDVVAVSSAGSELQQVKDAGGRVVTVEMQRHISPIKDFKSLFGLISVFRKEKPTMVHSMTPKAGLLCMMAARFTRVPVRVHTFTGLVFPTAKRLTKRILMATDWLTCACATHVIPEGEGVKVDLLNHHITKKPIKVLGYGNVRGIDLNRFDRTAEVMTEAEKLRKPSVFTFIFIGRLVGDKGINELVEAFERLNQEYPATRLILVGGKEQDLDPLKPKTIEKIDTNPAIEAVGEKTDVRPWLAASDCFVFPSYREGFPNVVLEAGAMGLPSIVTDINGSREIIIEGQNGVIIPSHDSVALYEAMKRFLANPAEVATLAANTRPLIASRYEQSYVRQCLKDFYREILPK